MSLSPMITFRQEKKVVLQDVPELDQDFAKEIALALLQGDVKIKDVSRSIESPDLIHDLDKYYPYSKSWVTEEVKLMLPKGITLTIEREVLK
ncbi:hypothetical protein M4D68_00640 [Priestia aryabhattai]|uniref:hypothetical protein n=1 Tax=Priestia aryabhattai TaxID=412384 RepID=UPI00203C0A33|nr:hypothetical protein [Priestia aryabhattai]MCM3639653.1 hypothetical protein [Priestia aryabhattai]